MKTVVGITASSKTLDDMDNAKCQVYGMYMGKEEMGRRFNFSPALVGFDGLFVDDLGSEYAYCTEDGSSLGTCKLWRILSM